MAKEIPFEEKDSTGMFGQLMDESAANSKYARDVAVSLLEMAERLTDRAEKMRHLAAILVLDANASAMEYANLISLEFGEKMEEEVDGG